MKISWTQKLDFMKINFNSLKDKEILMYKTLSDSKSSMNFK